MASSYLKRIAHGNASSSSLPASSSSNAPAQAVGSASNDAASVKGKSKFSKFFHRGRRNHTNKTGDVAATSSRSVSPVLQANKSSTTSSQPLANAQTTTTKDSPDTKNLANTSSGNKTANAALILEIVKNICEVLDKVPYVKVVTGLATTAITIIEAVNACKEEWDKVKDNLNKVRDIVFKFRYGRDDSAPLPDDVTDAFRELEICLRKVLDAVIRYRDVSAGRLVLERSALKAEATSCVGCIDMAVKVFQMKVLVGMRLVGDQTHHIVEKILTIVLSTQQGPTPSPSLNLNVLACPAPSQYFTGRESDLRKLSRMLAAPVVTLFSTNSNALSAFVHSFDHSSRFTAIFLDASSVEALSMGLKEIVYNIKPNNSVYQPLLLVLENADPSLQLDQYLPYSLHNPILVTSTNKAVSHFASLACEFELFDSTDQWAADSLYRSIERAFAPLLHVVTIVARGGTGKTQLVLQFVSEDPSRFMHVWFFDATSDATLAAGYQKLSKAASIDESVNDVQDFLEKMQEDWLLIFDNADDPNVELSKYIPRCNHGNIIITSRLTDQMASPGAYLDFSDLEQSDAVNLLLKHAHEDFDINNQQLASYIVDAFGCQALAVATAGAYIASTATCTLSNYLSLFKQKSKQLLNYKMKSFDGYQKTVFNAFQLSFDQLSSSTKLFMQICAFFHHTAIPIELFYRAAAFTDYDLEPEEKENTPAVEELKDFLSLFTHEWSWNDSIDELSRFSLIIYNTGVKALSFHPILYICIQKTIDDKKKLYYIALFLLARGTSDSTTDISYQFRRLLLAHADYIYQNNLCTFLAYNSFGRIFMDAGLWKKAKQIYQKALEHCECYFEKHHLNTLKSMNSLGSIYARLGQLEEANVLQTETLKLHKEVLGEYHPNTLISMGNLASTYCQLGQWEEAKVLQTETLKLCKEVLGEHHPDTLVSMSNLTLTYCQLEQWEEAKVLETETLKLHKEVLGEHHPDTLLFIKNLACVANFEK
ncbi:hypothetical protein ARMGADRAFT_965352 [Armillaria gallica]|uniref:Uncharacterized protein n=1 Tax=Armillaria gallica TaxID=47427 RepID=A0A2H3DZN6_ARMGA|nr:hypothetical protein ARMGADRAFT_965352 [Armillaria gallica]